MQPGILEIILVIIAVVGTIMIFTNKKLNNTQKVIWFFVILSFNIVGLLGFLIWKFTNKTSASVD